MPRQTAWAFVGYWKSIVSVPNLYSINMQSVLLLLSAALKASATIYYAGVAESGGEFGLYVNQDGESLGLPGRFGSDYAFINPDTVDVFVDEQGFNLFQVAFVLERLCPLDTGLGATFNETVSILSGLPEA